MILRIVLLLCVALLASCSCPAVYSPGVRVHIETLDGTPVTDARVLCTGP